MKIKIDDVILNNWIILAGAGIITLSEAKQYLKDGYIHSWQFARMFPFTRQEKEQ